MPAVIDDGDTHGPAIFFGFDSRGVHDQIDLLVPKHFLTFHQLSSTQHKRHRSEYSDSDRKMTSIDYFLLPTAASNSADSVRAC
ncbi:hypothetical protein D3C81_2037670 [compost metagenome]